MVLSPFIWPFFCTLPPSWALSLSWALLLFSNSTIRSGAFMFSHSSQKLWALEYPFQQIRYCFSNYCVLMSRICSTFHSGLPSMRSGGGSVKFSPCSSISLYGWRSLAWKTLCIFQWEGSSRQKLACPTTSRTLNNPYRSGPNFCVGCVVCRFVPFSHTLSPPLYSL